MNPPQFLNSNVRRFPCFVAVVLINLGFGFLFYKSLHNFTGLADFVPDNISRDFKDALYMRLFSVEYAFDSASRDAHCQSDPDLVDALKRLPKRDPLVLDCPRERSTFGSDRVLRIRDNIGRVSVTTRRMVKAKICSLETADWKSYSTPLNLSLPDATLVRVRFEADGNKKSLQEDFHVEPKKYLFETSANRTQWLDENGVRRPSILVLFHDGMIRSAFTSSMPWTREWLETRWNRTTERFINNLPNNASQDKFSSFVFSNVAQLGTRTIYNVMPFLTGLVWHPQDELSEERRKVWHYMPNDARHPAHAFITNQLISPSDKKSPWLTSYGHAYSNQIMGCFKNTDFLQFSHQPPILYPPRRSPKEVALDCWRSEHSYLQKDGLYRGSCAGSRSVPQHELHWLQKLWEKNPRIPKFAIYHGSYTHKPNPRDRVQVIDVAEERTIRNVLEADPNTIVIVLGDHGHKPREQPFLSLTFPTAWLDARSASTRTLFNNQERLITMLDLHKTLINIIGLKNQQVKTAASPTHTIFDLTKTVVPYERNCSDAGVPQSQCPCNGETFYVMIDLDKDKNARQALDAAFAEANSNEGMGTLCPLLTIATDPPAKIEMLMPRGRDYRLTFAVEQGGSHERPQFMVTAERLNSVSDEKSSNWRLREFVQLTMYNQYDDCRAPGTNPRFCFCHDNT